MSCPQARNTAAIHSNDQVILAFPPIVAEPRRITHCRKPTAIKMHLNISAIEIDMNVKPAWMKRWA
jgi:hypothetical protein